MPMMVNNERFFFIEVYKKFPRNIQFLYVGRIIDVKRTSRLCLMHSSSLLKAMLRVKVCVVGNGDPA